MEAKKCLVLGDLIVRNVGTERTNRMARCFPGIRNEQLHRVMGNGDLRNPQTVVILVMVYFIGPSLHNNVAYVGAVEHLRISCCLVSGCSLCGLMGLVGQGRHS